MKHILKTLLALFFFVSPSAHAGYWPVLPVSNGGTGAATAPAGAAKLLGYSSTALNPSAPYFTALSGNTGTGLLNVYNYANDPASFPNFRRCFSNVKTGAGRCRVVVFSDSTAFGWGSQGGGSDVKTYAWPSQLAKSFAATFGVPADYDGFLGNSNGQFNLGHDPRLSTTANWTADTNSNGTTVGGTMIYDTSATGVLSFTPVKPVDTCWTWTPSNSAIAGQTGAAIDSGTVTNIALNGSSGTLKTVLTAPALGNHTLNFTNTSTGGNAAFVTGAECFDSKHPGVSFVSAGWYGSLSNTNTGYGWTYAGNAWSPFNAVKAVAGDLNVLALDLNDGSGQTGITAYKANIQSLITQIQSGGGDLVIATEGHENSTGNNNDAAITPYVQAIYQVAAANNIPVIDTYSRQVSGPYVSSAGWFYTDNIHYNAQGYADVAQTYMTFFQSILGTGHGIGPAIVPTTAAGDVNFLNASSAATTYSPSIAAFGSDTNIPITLSPKGTAPVIAGGPIKTNGYTVSTLPTGAAGMRAYVTDQASSCPAAGGTLTGSGTVTCPVFFNGAAWVGD